MGLKTRALSVTRLFLCIGVLALLLTSGCSYWWTKKTADRPLVIKAEDFSLFLFESSEEIYRANVKDPDMWATLRKQADQDPDYAVHYSWLYDSYAKWDENRRTQLKLIMADFLPQPMSDRLIQNGKQSAGLDEIISFMKEDSFFGKDRNTLVDFYAWYGQNYALPHYEQIKPLLQQKAEITAGKVDKDFDITGFIEKETGIKLKKKPDPIELLFNMRIIGASGYYRDKTSLTTIQWNSTPERIWAVPFQEDSQPYFRTFTGSWSFKYLASKLKKDEKLMTKFNEDVPYTWEGWIEANLTQGFARYLNVRKGIAKDVGQGVYIFDQEYAQALVEGFDPQKTSLKDFTVKFLKQKYGI